MNTRKLLKLVSGALLALLFLWLMVRQIRLEEIKQALVDVNARWIATAALAFAVGYTCRIERWRLMLKRDSPDLKWTACAGPLLASFAANNVLPFRAGDVLRSFAFSRQLGTSYGVVIATLFVERLLDLLMVLLLLGAGLALFDMDSVRFAGLGSVVLVASTLTILIVLLCPDCFAPLAKAAGRFAALLLPKLGQRLSDEIDRSLATLRHLAKGSTVPKLIFWSLLAWSAEGCVFWFTALALPSITAPQAGWLALPVGTLATLLPSTPGYVGTFDYFTVSAMTKLSNTTGAATAYALVVHALLWLPPTLAGGLYLLLHPVRRQNRLQTIRS